MPVHLNNGDKIGAPDRAALLSARVKYLMEEDKAIKERIDASNDLEEYAYYMKAKGIKAKLDEDDAEALEEAVQDTFDWLDENQEAELEEYQEKQKELEGIVNPIMQKLCQEPMPKRARLG